MLYVSSKVPINLPVQLITSTAEYSQHIGTVAINTGYQVSNGDIRSTKLQLTFHEQEHLSRAQPF